MNSARWNQPRFTEPEQSARHGAPTPQKHPNSGARPFGQCSIGGRPSSGRRIRACHRLLVIADDGVDPGFIGHAHRTGM